MHNKTDRSTSCSICGSDVEKLGSIRILGHHNVSYYRCGHCDFVQTENPYWLDEAYSSPIAALDIGLIQRNIRFSEIAQRVLKRVLKTSGPCIDYGGGYGMFVRLMRDKGSDFFHFDPLAENLFAPHFTATTDREYVLATSFEVLEHLPEPHEHFAKLDKLAPHWLFSTELISSPAPALNKWWYYLPETGQHVSFYSKKSLELIAKRYNRRLISSGNGLHFFTSSKASSKYIRWVLKNRSSRLFDFLIRDSSLLQTDFDFILRKIQSRKSAA